MVLIKTSNVYSTLLALLVPAGVRVFYKIVPRSSMELAHLVLSFGSACCVPGEAEGINNNARRYSNIMAQGVGRNAIRI